MFERQLEESLALLLGLNQLHRLLGPGVSSSYKNHKYTAWKIDLDNIQDAYIIVLSMHYMQDNS